jgi:serine/threonine protein phosphatase 1
MYEKGGLWLMKIERLLVVGDIHGAWDKFQSMYAKVRFNPEQDVMVFLGDYLDRGDNPVSVMDFILEHQNIDRMIFLRGNHEQMFREAFCCPPLGGMEFGSWFTTSKRLWFDNGGRVTFNKINKSRRKYELFHAWLSLIDKLPLYKEISAAGKTYWFMHADCEPGLQLVDQIPHVMVWGRSLARHPELNQGDTVIVLGHTPVQYLGYEAKPQLLNDGKVVLMDTGSCTYEDGRVSCADLLSGEIYQSD